MKWRAGWVVSAGLALATTAASAVTLAPTEAGRLSHGGAAIVKVSDFKGPYAALPEGGPMMPRYAGALLPPEEVYAVLRETGFSPLGIPRLRGAIYVIAAVDRSGDDGRLFIDARSGRILSFMPAYQMGGNYREELGSAYGAYNPQAAPRIASAILERVKLLSEHPMLGKTGRIHTTRELVVTGTPYTVIYLPQPGLITILRVFHQAQEW